MIDHIEVKKIPLADHPRAMEIDDTGTYLYVACTDGSLNRILIDGDTSGLEDSTNVTTPICDLKLSGALNLAVLSHVTSDTVSLVGLRSDPVPFVPYPIAIVLLFSGLIFIITRK